MIPFPFALGVLALVLAAARAYVAVGSAVGSRAPPFARRGARAALALVMLSAPLLTSGPGPVALTLGLLAGYLAIRATALAATRGPATLGALLSVDDLLRPVPAERRHDRPRALALGLGGLAACVALLAAGDAVRLWRWSRYADGLLVCLEVAVGAMGLHNLILAVARGPVAGLEDRPALAASLGEFWASRWNHLVAPNLDRGFFRPLARRGRPRAGVLAAFGASGVMHVVPVLAAAPLAISAGPALQVFAFFMLHGALVLLERALGRSRAPSAGRALVFARVRTVTLFVLLSPIMLGPFADVCHVHGRALRFAEGASPLPRALPPS
jgi:hypothetical protein